MKRLFITLVLVLVPSILIASSGMQPMGWMVGGVAESDECEGYIVCQNFEGTGYDNSETWVEDTDGACTGCVTNEDYATSPLRGSQSLLINDGTVASWTVTDFSARDSAYVFFMFKLTEAPSDDADVMTLLSDYDSYAPKFGAGVLITSGRKLKIFHYNYGTSLTASDNGDTVLELNTKYYIWFYAAKGTGSNGVAWVKINTVNEEPAGTEVSISSGQGLTDSLIHMQFSTYHGAAYEYIVDQALLKSTAIGSVPE